MRNRCVHDVGQRFWIQADQQYARGECQQQARFTPVKVGQLRDARIGHAPNCTRLYILNVYAALRISVNAASRPIQKLNRTAARITINSPTKPEVPGSPQFAIENSSDNAANFGITLTTPP